MKTSLAFLLLCVVATTLACFVTVISGSGPSPSTSKQEQIAREAERRHGSTLWSYSSSHQTEANTWKCNIFVAEVIKAAGAKVPNRHVWWSPIGTEEWANPDSHYLVNSECWTHVNYSSRGDVAADSSYMGIVTGTRKTASAAKYRVITNDWGFRPGQSPTFWHYKC